MSLSVAPQAVSSGQRSSSRYVAAAGPLLAFIVAFAAVAVFSDRSLLMYDEGLVLTGAMRVADGAVIHRDFYANYGPGQFYALAGVFKILGQAVLAERAYDVLVKAGIACLAFLIASRLMKPPYAIAVTGFCIVLLCVLRGASYPIWPGLLFIELALLPLLSLFEGRLSFAGLVWSGLCVGVATVFRYDMGFFACGAITTVLLVFAPFGKHGALTRLRTLLAPFWLGVAIVVGPLLGSYALSGAIHDFVFQIIEFPAAHYAQMRALPFPNVLRVSNFGVLFNSIIYLPLLALASYVALIVSQYGSTQIGSRASAWSWGAFLVAAMSFALYFKGLVRKTPLHMAPSILLSCILLGFVVEQVVSGRLPSGRKALVMLVTATTAVLFLTSLAGLVSSRRFVERNIVDAYQSIRSGSLSGDSVKPDLCGVPVKLERMRCFLLRDEDYQAMLFVQSNSGPNDTIFVGTGDHDKIFVNNLVFYFAVDREPATKWYHFDPGLQTTKIIQSEIIKDIKRNEPKFIVIDSEWDDNEEPNDSSLHSGVKDLDDFIVQNYPVVAKFGTYTIRHAQK